MRALFPLAIAALAVGMIALPGAGAAPVGIDLPFDDTPFPELSGGPSAAAINENCRSCHSASMVLNQPRLTRAEWAVEVAKMRTAYEAPVAPADDAAIIDWLAAYSTKSAG
jgi:hypothetical protein